MSDQGRRNRTRCRWPLSRSRTVVIGLSLVAGPGLLFGALGTEGWTQSVMIEIGASVFLLAPLAVGEDLLRQRLRDLDVSLRSSVAGLSAIRRLLPPGERRTSIFDEILRAVTAEAAAQGFPRKQVEELVGGDSDDRTVALAAMEGRPAEVVADAVVRSLRRPDYGNEQYYALRAAEAAWSSQLTREERSYILAALDEDDRQRGWIRSDPYRREIAERLRNSSE